MELISGTRPYVSVNQSNEAALDRFIQEAGIKQGDADVVQKVIQHFNKEYS